MQAGSWPSDPTPSGDLPRHPDLLRGALLLLALLAVACAAPKPLLVSPGGRLRIVNAAGEPLEVFARGGRIVTRLPDGAEARLDRLPLGECPVEARGERTGWRMGTTLQLSQSDEATWNVRGTEAHVEALKALPTGRVRFVNRSPEPVRAFVDDASRELVWPGGEAEYGDLVPGPHHLKAEGTQTAFRSEADVVVAPGSVSSFEVLAPRAGLRVTNGSGAPARIAVRDEAERLVSPGASMTLDELPPGPIDISARDGQGRFLWAGSVTLAAGQVADALVPAPEGVVSVLSYVTQPLSIWVDGTNLGLCAPSGAAEFKGLPIGRVQLQAMDPGGGIVARSTLAIVKGAPTLWMVREGDSGQRRGDEGSLAVENGTGEPLHVQVDGSSHGDVEPGARRIVPGLLPGNHVVAVAGLRSRDVLRAEVEVPAGGTASWTAKPRSATLALRNDRPEEVRVRVDGETRARIAPAQSLDLSLPAGSHVVESVGVTSLRTTVHRLVLPASVVTRLVLPPSTATLVVTNRHGEALSLADGDRQLGVVLPGDRVTLRDLVLGDHFLEARSLDRPLSWHVKVSLAAGDTFAWDLGD